MAARDVEAGRAHVLIRIRDHMTQGLKTAERKLQAFGRYVTVSAGVATAGIGAGLLWPLKLSANMEQTQVAFEVFLGSADKAKKLLGEIEQMAAVTPFTFDDLKDAGQLLANFGVAGDDLISTMSAIGETSAGNAERFQRLALAYGQVIAKGRLMGQEALQMTNAGFSPLAEISRTTGRGMRELGDAMERGEVSVAMLRDSFISASSKGGMFHGMMVKQSQTLIGLLSTLHDNAAMMARAFGDALVPAIKTAVQIAITISQVLTKWVTQNQALVGTIAKIAAVLFAVASVFTGLGVAVMAASFVVGLMGTALAAIKAVILTVFSPIGALIAVLVGIAIAAYQFRAAIATALSGFAVYFKPAYDAVMQLAGLFSDTFHGIVSALSSGNLAAAGEIAWNGLFAVVLTATAGIIDFWTGVMGAMGQAILAGNWSLAAWTALLELQVAVTSAINPILNMWSDFVTGMGSVWDSVTSGMVTGFREVYYGIAHGLGWLSEKLTMLLGLKDPLGSMGDELNKMQNADQQAANKKQSQREATRTNANAETQKGRETELATQQAELETLRIAAYAARPKSGADLASDARKKLAESIKGAKKESEAVKDKGYDAAKPSLAAAQSVVPNAEKRNTSGTFSAIASALGNMTGNAAETTAKNTATLVRIAKKQLDKKDPGLAP